MLRYHKNYLERSEPKAPDWNAQARHPAKSRTRERSSHKSASMPPQNRASLHPPIPPLALRAARKTRCPYVKMVLIYRYSLPKATEHRNSRTRLLQIPCTAINLERQLICCVFFKRLSLLVMAAQAHLLEGLLDGDLLAARTGLRERLRL